MIALIPILLGLTCGFIYVYIIDPDIDDNEELEKVPVKVEDDNHRR